MDVKGGLTCLFGILRSLSLSLSKRKAPEFQSEKQSVLDGENKGKRKSAITFVIALFFLVAGTGLEPVTFGL